MSTDSADRLVVGALLERSWWFLDRGVLNPVKYGSHSEGGRSARPSTLWMMLVCCRGEVRLVLLLFRQPPTAVVSPDRRVR